MSRHILLSFAVASVLSSTARARAIDYWPYDQLMKEADLVVIAKPIRTKNVDESFRTKSWKATFRGVETEFKVGVALKGKVDSEAFTLLHYRFEPDPEERDFLNGPLLVSFRVPRGEQVALSRGGYLLFLRKRADGRYEPVSGKVDPALAVRELKDVMAR